MTRSRSDEDVNDPSIAKVLGSAPRSGTDPDGAGGGGVFVLGLQSS